MAASTLAPQNYQAIGQQIAQAHGIPWNLFHAVINQESGWRPDAVSPVGAIGFGQLMPGTAKTLGVNPKDPVQNLQGSAKFLSNLYQKFGSWDLALAAYNAGPGAVQKYGGIPPYQETQNYVKSIMANAGNLANAAWGTPGANKPQPGTPPPPGTLSPGLVGLTAGPSTPLQNLLDFAGPSQTTQQNLGALGGIAAKFTQGAAKPIDPGAQLGLPQLNIPGLDASVGGAGPKQDPYQPDVVPLGKTLAGQIPMVTGGNITAKYPNLHAASHVDWEHINPRLLQVLNDVAAKQGAMVVLNSGYRSNQYSAANGGFANDPHTKGVAVDAYINGHPIGDVIPPEVWAKYGVRSGNTPGFYNGKPDPEHLDLIGVPVKGGPKA